MSHYCRKRTTKASHISTRECDLVGVGKIASEVSVQNKVQGNAKASKTLKLSKNLEKVLVEISRRGITAKIKANKEQ